MSEKIKYNTIGEHRFVEWPWSRLESQEKVLETCKRYIDGFLVHLQRTNIELYRELSDYFEQETDQCVRNIQGEYEYPELMGYPAVARYVEKKYPELVPEILKYQDLASQRKVGVLDELWSRTVAVMRLLDYLRESDAEAYQKIRASFTGFGPDISSRNAVRFIKEYRPDLIPVMIALVDQSKEKKREPAAEDDFDA